ncbi:MAG: choice-of-anchor J domain-containing protein [Muribaculaceae bacterium]|nr:choice-of-anchor J domain-containing protein [Muribaculaceae bacterium]
MYFNKIATYIKTLGAAALLAGTFAACQDDVDAPGVDFPQATSTPNTTIAELKELFWSDETNYADTIRDKEDPAHRYVIHGRVISSDEQSNVFKSLIIQDETAAMAFSIDAYNLYLNYRIGQEIVLDVTDMFIGKYAGLQQMGRPSWYANGKSWQVSFMSLEYFTQHAELNGIPVAADIDTLTVNSFSEISATPEGLRKWQSQLVRFKNVYFADGGQKNFSVYHSSSNDDQNRTIVDRNGGTMIVRTSGYASFAEDKLPTGNVDVVGILSYYNSAWQIILNDREGVIAVGNVPGSKEDPYDVPGAIADIEAGVDATGWLKGYIVGAVAPAVEVVASNDDIEWTAPTVTSSTLVVAADPSVKNYKECIIVALPSESLFQQVGNLRDNPDNLGKEIRVMGKLGNYLGSYGMTGNSGKSDEFAIEGVDSGEEIPEGDGSEDKPFNTAQIVAMNPSSTTAAVETGVWVEGYIVGSMPTGGSSTTLSGTNFSTEDAATTNLVLGPTPDCTDASKCVGVQLPTNMRADLALANKPGNLGKKLAVKGDIMKYCGGPGVKNLTANRLDDAGGTPDQPVTPPAGDFPDGDGQKDTPYNVAQIIAFNPSSTTDAVQSGVWVKGYIVGSMPTGGSSTLLSNTNFSTADAATTNLVLGPTATCTDASQCIGVQLPASMRDALALANKPENLGKVLAIKGDIMKYCGGPGVKNLTENVFDGSGSTTPDQPVTPPDGDVVYSALGASEAALTTGWTFDAVSGDNPWSWRSYNGNNYLNGSAFVNNAAQAADAYAVSPVIDLTAVAAPTMSFDHAAKFQTTLRSLCGVAVRLEGASQWISLAIPTWPAADSWTFVNSGSIDLSAYAGKKIQIAFHYGSTTSGADTWEIQNLKVYGTGGQVTPPTPPVGDGNVINLSDFEGVDGPATITVGQYTVSVATGTGTTKPKYYSNGMRLYKGNTLTITGPTATEIVFEMVETAQYGPFTPSTGKLDPAQAVGDTSVTWKGNATEVTFTVGDTADFATNESNRTKPGQFRFKTITIK